MFSERLRKFLTPIIKVHIDYLDHHQQATGAWGSAFNQEDVRRLYPGFDLFLQFADMHKISLIW